MAVTNYSRQCQAGDEDLSLILPFPHVTSPHSLPNQNREQRERDPHCWEPPTKNKSGIQKVPGHYACYMGFFFLVYRRTQFRGEKHTQTQLQCFWNQNHRPSCHFKNYVMHNTKRMEKPLGCQLFVLVTMN